LFPSPTVRLTYERDLVTKEACDRAERIKLLSRVDVLEPLTSEEIDRLAQKTPEHTFGKGESVYAPGDASEAIFLLLTGSIRLYGLSGGNELTFDVLRSGTVFGIASLMERTHNEYALTLEPSRVGVLGLSDFWHLIRKTPEVNARLVKVLGDRLRLTRSRMLDIALKETPARLASLLLDLVQSEGVVTREGHYKIVVHYTHEQLGAMIGANRVSISRAFGKLQDVGYVQLFRRRIYVVDLAALRQLAGAG
jgi:CRP-like cAMP-binding protein